MGAVTFYEPEGQVSGCWGDWACGCGQCQVEGTDGGTFAGTAVNAKKDRTQGSRGGEASAPPELLACGSFPGHCWCVDRSGEYVPGSLTARSAQVPQCK